MSPAELGASLRRCTTAAQRLGRSHLWLAENGAPTPRARPTKSGDVLGATCADADGHAALLVQSSLEHAEAVAHYITRRSPVLPHTIGRTAVEHAFRALHYLDPEADELERATRRLNEWLYALEETGRRRQGIVEAAHPGADHMPDELPMRERIFAKAADLGLKVTRSRGNYYVGSQPRRSTMWLAERYLSAMGGEGVASAAMRLLAGMDHGVETALLSSAAYAAEPTGFKIHRLGAMATPFIAFCLMAVPVASINAIRALGSRNGWSAHDKLTCSLLIEQEAALVIWTRSIREYLDVVAPARADWDIRPFQERCDRRSPGLTVAVPITRCCHLQARGSIHERSICAPTFGVKTGKYSDLLSSGAAQISRSPSAPAGPSAGRESGVGSTQLKRTSPSPAA